MWRGRALKIVLVLVGLLFTAGVYPLIGSLLHTADSDTGDTMMLSLYVVLGIFLLLASRNPSANRSLIAFTAWSSLVHAAIMAVQASQHASERGHLLGDVPALVIVGIALIVLAPAKQTVERAAAARV